MESALEPAIIPSPVHPLGADGLPPGAQETAPGAAVLARPSNPGVDPVPPGAPRRPARLRLLPILGHGARRVLGQPRLLFFVWGLALATSMAASSPAMVMLGMLLGKRPAAVPLARGQADFLFGELLEDHPVAVAIIVASVLLAAVLFFFTHLSLSGGLLSALRRPGHPQRTGPALSQIVSRGLATTGAMLQVELWFFLLVRGPILLLLAGLVALGLRSKYPDTHSLPEILAWVGPALGLLLWLWCSGTVVLYAARLVRLAQTAGEHSAWRAVLGGARQTLGSLTAARLTLTLGLLAALGMTALVIVGRVLAARLDYALLVTSALLVRQGFALLRSMLTLWVMAGTVELCDRAA